MPINPQIADHLRQHDPAVAAALIMADLVDTLDAMGRSIDTLAEILDAVITHGEYLFDAAGDLDLTTASVGDVYLQAVTNELTPCRVCGGINAAHYSHPCHSLGRCR